MTNLELKPNLELSKEENWLRHNNLSLNLSKTNYLLIQNKSRLEKGEIKLKVNDSPLKQSAVVKYLGVYIDDDLNWSAHIQHLQKQLQKQNNIMRIITFSSLRQSAAFV